MSDSEIIYRIRSDTLSHAQTSKYESKYVDKKVRATRRTSTYTPTKSIIGRARTNNPYGNYKNPYYDPQKRHEYYEAHKDHPTRPYGTGGSGGSGKGSGGSGKGSGKGKGKGKGNGSKLAETIQALREESSLNTEAQREATKRKIEDLRKQIKQHTEKLSRQKEDQEEGLNVSEIRGNVQNLKDQIEKAGGDLQKWITHERDALERRIAAVYAKHGQKYKVTTQADKENQSKKRQKEVKSRADSIYKSKKS